MPILLVINQTEPIVTFALLLAVILIVPLCFERIKLPGLLGLLAAGVVLGQNGLNLLSTDSETMKLLSDIGLVYLMFVAGLEVDIEQFQHTRNRSIGFGFFTFIVPMIVGTIVGRMFGFGWNASILIGSLFASHTLLAYPIVSRMGLVNNEAVMVTIGATIFTDIGALLVLAVCVGIHAGNFTTFSLIRLLLSLAIYSAIILFGFSWLGKEFFRRSGSEEGNQFLFILLVVFVSALGAELIGVEKIVGAFLAGLAVNSAIGDGPVKEKVVFVGSVLFIPIFFVDLGLLINIPAFISSLGAIKVTIAVVLGLVGSKFGAALLAKLAYRYSWREMIVMWSLSLPQVAATLAATLVGYRVGLLTEDILNSVIVLMLVTATGGPLLTARSAIGLTVPETIASSAPGSSGAFALDLSEEPEAEPVVVVPVYNPDTEQYLIELAALLVKPHPGGRVMPLAITNPHTQMMDAPQLRHALQRSQRLLNRASEICEQFGVASDPILRIDDAIAQGISHASREQNASFIVLGWGRTSGFRARAFGNLIDSVLWAAHCPVAVSRLLAAPSTIRRILVPIENMTQDALRSVRFAEALADTNQAQITLLHVADRHLSPVRLAWLENQLDLLVHKYSSNRTFDLRVVRNDDIPGTIAETARAHDLVVLRSRRQRLSLGELTISNVTEQVTRQLTCSVVLLGEPQRSMVMMQSGGTTQPVPLR
ncbi:cation:proton antiporter [Microcoleus sp. FACHB-1515]|uniref:cation:proton antiporter domain-containing protein n=1 Tax=Cyanophyceae TaxID=3028117 RepID=UPI001689AB29|nr:cation:proton antiporter [Microcoleus sp. FACHB-1515]MBD2092972.1 cation:proton antiporter [Microcoleus sp. FACHB-1515]